MHCLRIQLLLRSKTRYYSRGSIIADSREDAKGLFVITSGQVCGWSTFILVAKENKSYLVCFQVGAELPVDSDDAENENKSDSGSTLLCVFERGCVTSSIQYPLIRVGCESVQSDICLGLTCFYRDCIGDSSLAGDVRWAGTFGVSLDFVARTHCSVEFISLVCATLSG